MTNDADEDADLDEDFADLKKRRKLGSKMRVLPRKSIGEEADEDADEDADADADDLGEEDNYGEEDYEDMDEREFKKELFKRVTNGFRYY